MLPLIEFAALGWVATSRFIEVRDVFRRANVIETYSVIEGLLALGVGVSILAGTI